MRVVDLEVLVALIHGGNRWWDFESMAARTGTDPSDARRILEGLAAQNLLDIRISDAVRYRLQPGRDDLARSLDALALAYRKDPVAVLNFVADGRGAVTHADSHRVE